MTPTNSVALTGIAAFCAAVIKDPIVSFVLMTVILLTCATVMVHILLSCWSANRRAIKKKKERRNGIPKIPDIPQ